MKKKWHEYVGVRQALIGAVAIIIVAGMHIWNGRSQLAKDNSTLKTENSGYAKTIEDRNAAIADLNQQIQRLETRLIPFDTFLLLRYSGSEEERLKQFAEEIQRLKDPSTKLIASATARVEVTIKSEEKTQTYMNAGGYLVFVKDRKPLLLTASRRSDVRQNGKGEATYKGDFSIEPGQSAVGKPIEVLQGSELIQMTFKSMPAKSQILHGNASVVINGDTRFEFLIPPQQMQDERFFIRDVKRGFATKQSSDDTR